MNDALSDAIKAYEEAKNLTPNPLRTLRGILEVEVFKHQLAVFLDTSEHRLSALVEANAN